MKKIILILVLSLCSVCFAGESTFTRSEFDAGELVKEIEASTGLKLTGIGQQGYVATKGSEIKVILNDRDLTSSEVSQIDSVLLSHDPLKENKRKSQVRKDARTKLKTLGLTEEEVRELIP